MIPFEDDAFEVSSIEELRSKYGLVLENAIHPVLNPEKVPTELRHLIPLAEYFGITDDIIRDDIVLRAPEALKQMLLAAIEEHDHLFDLWLAGPESDGPYTEEYLAFSAMRMASYMV